MKKILIPTDFSDNARNAFEYAIALFGPDVKYVLFNSYEEPRAAASSMVSLREILMESSEDSLKEEKDHFLGLYPELSIENVSVYGDPTDSVVRTAARKEVEVIVMGTAGATGVEKFFLGSTAASVIEGAHCPVIVVPKKYTYEAPKKVLLAADLDAKEKDALPAMLIDLIARNESEVTILTVAKEDEEIDIERAEKGFEIHTTLSAYPHRFDVVSGGDVGETIRSYAHDNNMQLLVTTPRKSSWFDRLLHPSVSKDIAEHLEIPMLAIH